MYLCISRAPKSGVWAIVDGDKFIGFISGCANVGKTYRWLLSHCGIRLAISAGLALLRFTVLRKLYSVLLYPLRQHGSSTNTLTIDAELLAIAIDESEYGKGCGRQLVHAFEASLLQWGVREYRVLTNIAEVKSNAFYRATGFAPDGTFKHHALTLQAYKKVISK